MPTSARLKGAPLLFFDGTLFTNDEMIVQGLMNKTGDRIGHMNMSGADGSMAAFADLGVGAEDLHPHQQLQSGAARGLARADSSRSVRVGKCPMMAWR